CAAHPPRRVLQPGRRRGAHAARDRRAPAQAAAGLARRPAARRARRRRAAEAHALRPGAARLPALPAGAAEHGAQAGPRLRARQDERPGLRGLRRRAQGARPPGGRAMSAQRPLSAGDWLGAAGVVLIWGLNFVVMKVALEDLSPMLLGALRFTAASLPFLLFLPRPALPWRFLAGYGLAQGLGQFGFLFLGLELGMPAGMASVVMQTQAFVTLLLAWPVPDERATGRHWTGQRLSPSGQGIIVSATVAGPDVQ